MVARSLLPELKKFQGSAPALAGGFRVCSPSSRSVRRTVIDISGSISVSAWTLENDKKAISDCRDL